MYRETMSGITRLAVTRRVSLSVFLLLASLPATQLRATSSVERPVSCPRAGVPVPFARRILRELHVPLAIKPPAAWWPDTDPKVWYSWRTCPLDLLINDFEEILEEKRSSMRAAMAKDRSQQANEPHCRVSKVYCLKHAEAAYQVLGRAEHLDHAAHELQETIVEGKPLPC